jgi:F420-dependent oxidoreductase-like protein
MSVLIFLRPAGSKRAVRLGSFGRLSRSSRRRSGVRFDLDISQHQLEWAELVERARYAEDAGFRGAWVFDHFKPLYGDPSGPCLEAWTLLAALAASTDRIRLGAMVTGVTYRHPSILATEAVTVDHVSGGRLDLGIGAAWFEGEHEELGIRFPPIRERAERLEEAVLVMKALMSTDRATFEGKHYRLAGATYRPRPVQEPHPPVWIGAAGERLTIPIAARHADVWNVFGSVGALERKTSVLERHAEEAGRDPSDIVRTTDLSISESWDEVRSRLEGLRRLSFTSVVVSWPSEGKGRLEEFVERVMLEFTG